MRPRFPQAVHWAWYRNSPVKWDTAIKAECLSVKMEWEGGAHAEGTCPQVLGSTELC